MYSISLSHKTATIDIRKLFAFSTQEQAEFLNIIKSNTCFTGCVFLNTCNRTEIYFTGGNNAIEEMQNTLCTFKNIASSQALKFFNTYQGKKAIHHLFKVAGGMDSMLLGEDEILGQVKAAYQTALSLNLTNFTLNTVFKQAITYAKKAKTNTAISKTPISLGTLAANQVFTMNGEKKTVLLIGVSGKMGTVVAKNLLAKPNVHVLATSRNHKGENLLEAKYDNLDYTPYANRYSIMPQADVIISATSSPHYTVTFEDFVKTYNPNKKQLFIDLAVPPDIHSKIATLENITLYDIDHFQLLAKENNIQKGKEAQMASLILEEGYDETLKDLRFHTFLPKLPMVIEYFEKTSIESTIYRLKKTASSAELGLLLTALETLTEE